MFVKNTFLFYIDNKNYVLFFSKKTLLIFRPVINKFYRFPACFRQLNFLNIYFSV